MIQADLAGEFRTYDQVALQTRPAGRAAMFQNWRSLLFLHFPCEPEILQRLLPPELEVDTFLGPDGREAWLGLVAFRLEGVRPRFMPALPWVSAFPETNIRTYVRHRGGRPGVWFFSLDADQPMACGVARAWLGLNYRSAKMNVDDSEVRRYVSVRHSDGVGHCIEARFGRRLGPAQPGTLEFFLAERYLLYSKRRGQLITAQVHHEPYSLREVRDLTVSETLVRALDIEPRPFVHALAVDGVDTEIFAPRLARVDYERDTPKE